MKSCWSRDQSCVFCTGRQIFNHWTTVVQENCVLNHPYLCCLCHPDLTANILLILFHSHFPSSASNLPCPGSILKHIPHLMKLHILVRTEWLVPPCIPRALYCPVLQPLANDLFKNSAKITTCSCLKPCSHLLHQALHCVTASPPFARLLACLTWTPATRADLISAAAEATAPHTLHPAGSLLGSELRV